MYTLISAFLKSKEPNSNYQNVNIGEMSVETLYNTFSSGYIELKHPSLKRNIFVNLKTLFTGEFPINNLPFKSWLTHSVRNKTIIGSVTKPSYVKNTVKFADAIQAGYFVERVHPNDGFLGNTYPNSDLTDAYISKSMTNYDLLYKRCLTTVNGLLHLNIPASKGLRIKSAAETLDYTGDNHIGIVSFEAIGDVEQVQLKEEMLSEPDSLYGYRGGCYVNLDKDLTNKTVLLVLGGRLFGFDNTVKVVNNEGLIRLNLQFIDMIDVVRTLKNSTGAKQLDLDDVGLKFGGFSEDKVYNDSDVVKSLLLKTMQTFIVIVDSKDLYKRELTVNPTNLVYLKEVYQNLPLPYISDKGLMLSYWLTVHPTPSVTVYKLHVKDTFYRFPVSNTGLDEHRININNIDVITNESYDIGHLLEICSEKLEEI